MHHTSARTAITSLLAGNGFGERGLALATAAALGDADQQAVRLRQAALEHAAAMPSDDAGSSGSYSGPLLIAPLPADGKALCNQLCPALTEHGHDIGFHVACLAALVSLWPHVGSEERPVLRLRFLAGLAKRRLPAASALMPAQLCAWQRDLPTALGMSHASVASMKALLGEPSAKLAYRVIADHLGINADLATLSRVLGALTTQVRLQFHDPQRHLLHVLLGTVACERLVTVAAPEHLATLLAQLAHQLWWCRHEAGLTPVRTCLDQAPRPLAEAIGHGDLTAAQRAARASAKQPAEFWETIWKLFDERMTAHDPQWFVAMELISAIAWRTSTDIISPDDAAAVGTVFADLAYREKTTPELAAN